MNVLILEDDLRRVSKFRMNLVGSGSVLTWVRTAQAAIDTLKRQSFKVVFLDHDLWEHSPDLRVTGDGMEVVDKIPEIVPNTAQVLFIVHSLNIFRREQMVAKLKEWGYKCLEYPRIWEQEDLARIIQKHQESDN